MGPCKSKKNKKTKPTGRQKQAARPGEGKKIRRTRKFAEKEGKSMEKTLAEKRRKSGVKNDDEANADKIEEPTAYDIPNFWNHDIPELTEEIKLERKNLGVKIQDGTCPPPLKNFEGLPVAFCIPPVITKPSVIQKQAWPTIMCGLDMVGVAPTGSGKTLAYLLPMAYHCMHRRKDLPNKGPFALVVLPTRELAAQVHSVCVKSFRSAGVRDAVRSVAIYGGQGKEIQLDQLAWSTPPHIVCATPGRLIDLLGLQALTLKNVSMLVFDEGDRMLALGFEEQLSQIAQHISPTRQMLLFSATFPLKLREAADTWMKASKVVMRIATMELDGDDIREKDSSKTAVTVSPTIRQVVQVCAEHKKPRKMIRFIERLHAQERQAKIRNPGGIIVFCTKIKTVRFVTDTLTKHGYNAAPLHSELPQSRREQALHNFKAGGVRILVSTDVAARGIHVQHLQYVVNYDFPGNLTQYCHRIGRTGRQGAAGYAFSFFTRKFAPLAKSLLYLLESTNQTVDPLLKQLAVETNLDQTAMRVEDDNENNSSNESAEEEDEEDDIGEVEDPDAEEDAPEDDDMDEEEGLPDSDSELDEAALKSLAPRKGTRALGGVQISVPSKPKAKSNPNVNQVKKTNKPKRKTVRPRGRRGGKKNKK